jgi:putative flippase GtrA
MIYLKPSIKLILARHLGAEFGRFFVASLFGLAIDVLIAWALTTWINLSIVASADISLLTVAIAMYFVHEFWTFGGANQKFSSGRLVGVGLSTAVAFAIRSISLYTTSVLLGIGKHFVAFQVLFAAALSFICSFIIVRSIFRHRTTIDNIGRKKRERITP